MTERTLGDGDANVDGALAAVNLANASTGARATARRPNGGAAIVLGTILLTLGLVVFIVGYFAPEVRHPYGLTSLPAEPTTWKWPAIWGGAAAFQLGIVLWVVGQVVRAIFFLPGRDVANAELEIYQN